MSFVYGLITGLLIGGAVVAVYYKRIIAKYGQVTEAVRQVV